MNSKMSLAIHIVGEAIDASKNILKLNVHYIGPGKFIFLPSVVECRDYEFNPNPNRLFWIINI